MTVTAREQGLVSCHACRLVSRPSVEGDSGCPRCGVRLRSRKRDSLVRTTAFLLAAAVLFLPANLLPVMTTRSLTDADADTILSGVFSLWRAGSWPIAILVFVASIVVPGLKIGTLGFLVASSWGRSRWQPRTRTRLYRLLEVIGRWSMLDIFVMGVLAALVYHRAASVEINAGAIPFAAVVVLTMFASMSFDPRLIWDGATRRSHTSQRFDYGIIKGSLTPREVIVPADLPAPRRDEYGTLNGSHSPREGAAPVDPAAPAAILEKRPS